jgi:uncharacterized repeat protein (TIGR03803 family)
MNTSRILACAVAAAALSLGGCGGGGSGGGSGPTPKPPGPPTPPTPTPLQYSIGGTATGISGPGLSLLDNGGDLLSISAAGPFVFPTLLSDGAAYDVTVSTAPPTLNCTTTSGSGTVAKADVGNVVVICNARSYAEIAADSAGGASVSGKVAVGADGTVYFATANNVASGGSGGLYSLAPGASTAVLLHAFGGSTSDGGNPVGLTLSPDGSTLYGITSQWGAHGSATSGGTLYSYSLTSGTYTVLVSFGATPSDGQTPFVPPIFGSDGMLYGTTSAGGSSGAGTFYRYDPSNGTYTVLYQFAGQPSDAGSPYQLIQGGANVFYGAGNGGGLHNVGTVFRLNVSGNTATDTVLHNFGGTVAGQADGSNAFGVVKASDGRLYGATYDGGTNGDGVIYAMNTDGSGYTIMYNFAGGASDGANSWGGVVQGTDGKLYGLTTAGGSANGGTLWDITTSGSFTLVHSFGTSSGGTNPQNTPLTMLPDGRIYGGTASGGPGSNGVLWSYQ